jgi:hypothetical protein
MTIEQTVDIPANHRLHLDFELPLSLPVGKAKVELTVTPDEPLADKKMEEARKIWAWNRSHREEVRAKLQKLRGSLPPASFGGMDGVSYQRKVRAEWDDD